MSTVSKSKVISSLAWKFFERMGSQAITFVLSVILARILTPEEYGTVALITVFVSIATVFVQGGFNTALIQSNKAKQEDYSSILFFSLIIAALLYLVMFFSASLIARFYNMPILIGVTRVLSLILFPGAFNSIQVAYVTKQMQFKKLFVSNLISVTLSGLMGIVLAYNGAGIWAIVIQQITLQFSSCIALLFISEWKPQFVFSMTAVRTLIPFGSKVLASNLLVTVFLNIRSLIIGRVYDAKSLAYFNRGKTFSSTIMDAINGTIQTVMLPAYSNVQNDNDKLLQMLRMSVNTSCYIIFPCLMGLAAVSSSIIILILTEKWKASIIYMQLFAISYMFQPIQIASAQALKAIGRSDITLKLEIKRKAAEIICLVVAIPISVKAIGISVVIAGFISTILCFPYNKKILGYSYRMQFEDIAPSLIMSVIMFVAVELMMQFIANVWLQLIIGSFAGASIYILISILTKNSSMLLIMQLIKNKLRGKK